MGWVAGQGRVGWLVWEVGGRKNPFLYLMSRQDAYTVANAILVGHKMSHSH